MLKKLNLNKKLPKGSFLFVFCILFGNLCAPVFCAFIELASQLPIPKAVVGYMPSLFVLPYLTSL